jgi:ubiquinone/menaquinone biosynthesis C-methylase UbiE
VKFTTANAEKTPYPAGSFDAVTSIFLFHELPKPVRRRVAREVRRVLKPGGRFVVLDSAQYVEGRALAPFLDAFPQFYHEPFYAGYLRDDLETMLEECGFAVESSEPFFISKRVVAVKES